MTPGIALRRSDFVVLSAPRRAPAPIFRFEHFARRVRRETYWAVVSGQATRTAAVVIFSVGLVWLFLSAFNAAHLRLLETGSIF